MTLSPRSRLVLARHGRAVALSLALVALFAFLISGMTLALPGTTEVSEERDRETVTTEVRTSALVTADDSLYGSGTTVEDPSRYLLSDMPELSIEVQTEAPEGSDVTHELVLVTTASADEEAFWEERETLIEETHVVGGEPVRSETEIDMRALSESIEETEDRLSNVGSIGLALELRTTYDTGTYADEQTSSVPLELTADAYWFDGSLSEESEHAEVVTREVEEEPDVFAGAGLALVGLAAGVGSAFAWRRREEVVDFGALTQEVHSRRHAEWISNGQIPMWMGKDYVRLDTLEDVVDVAIDTNQRVVHDTERNLHAVIQGDVVYYYSLAGTWEEVAWPKMDMSGFSELAEAESEFDGEWEPASNGADEWVSDLDPEDEDSWESI
ncbi:DUF5305 domain-containing protein [Natronorarus salvus]|uniref:DUF5305 domain-containing protein n=1 Tax=Natronorarus salvus TaxID=3117733 RepID=UPI002F26D53C